VFPRPAKLGQDGKRSAPVRRGERYQLPDGTSRVAPSASTWSWCYTSGTKAAGTRRKTTKGGYPTKKAAQAALTQFAARYEAGDDRVLVKPEAIALGDYLERWLDQRATIPADEDHGLKPSTLAGYRDAIRAWIAPRDANGRWLRLPWLGAVELDRLGSDHLVDLHAALRTRGKRCRRCDRAGRLSYQPDGGTCPGCAGVGGHPLASRSVQLCHVVLKMALDEAVEQGKLARNPCDRIPRRRRPSAKKGQGVTPDRYWELDQAQRFLAATADSRLGPLWALALDTGARRGELSALRWEDVDLEAGRVAIRGNRIHVDRAILEGTTKSGKPRTVDLDAQTVERLKRWRATQAADRLAAGEAWAGAQPGTGPLWTDELGQPYRPDILSARFQQAQAAVDVPDRTIHALRHTSATILLARGIPAHVVQQRLGHADIKVTLGTYAHVLEGQDADAARVLGVALYGTAQVAGGS
jgi:integrase